MFVGDGFMNTPQLSANLFSGGAGGVWAVFLFVMSMGLTDEAKYKRRRLMVGENIIGKNKRNFHCFGKDKWLFFIQINGCKIVIYGCKIV